MPHVRPLVVAGLIGLALATSFAPPASAQQVFRIVGPDGRVTFSDKPPPGADAKVAPTVAVSAGDSGAVLPFELRQVASRFPVTLYTSGNCGACGSGRAFLTSRGIPFTEKTISSQEDAEALQRLAGESLVPLLTIGVQQLRGYSDSEWGQFLDAAGYPRRSVLPSSWRNPAPSALVSLQRPAVPAQSAAAEAAAAARRNPAPPPSPAPAAPAETGDNPTGIKF